MHKLQIGLIVALICCIFFVFQSKKHQKAIELPPPVWDEEEEDSWEPDIAPEHKEENADIKTYKDALELAKKTNKKLVLFFTQDHCPPCRKFENTTLKDNKVIDELKNFVFYKVEKRKEKTEFRIFVTPTLIITNGDEETIKKQSGYLSPEEFISWLKD